MQADDTISGQFERTATPEVERERTLGRLTELTRLSHEVERMRAGDRPVPLPLLRRAVFAAYRAAVDAGAEDEAAAILHPDSAASRES
jgi:hypothetical protein